MRKPTKPPSASQLLPWGSGVVFLPLAVVVDFAGAAVDVFGFVLVGAAGYGFGSVGHGDPFGDVAEGVVEAPGVGFELGDGVGLVVGVVGEPGDFPELWFGRLERWTAGAAGVFPLGFGGDAVLVAGALGEPLAVIFGFAAEHAAGGEPLCPQPRSGGL